MDTLSFTLFPFKSIHLSLEGSIISLASEVPLRVPRLCIASHVAMNSTSVFLKLMSFNTYCSSTAWKASLISLVGSSQRLVLVFYGNIYLRHHKQSKKKNCSQDHYSSSQVPVGNRSIYSLLERKTHFSPLKKHSN